MLDLLSPKSVCEVCKRKESNKTTKKLSTKLKNVAHNEGNLFAHSDNENSGVKLSLYLYSRAWVSKSNLYEFHILTYLETEGRIGRKKSMRAAKEGKKLIVPLKTVIL